MLALIQKGQPIDVSTLAEELKNHDQLIQAGGENYVFELLKNTPSASNILAYASIVQEKAVLRQLISIGGDLVSQGFNPQGRSIHELLDAAEQRIFAIAEDRSRGIGPQPLSKAVSQALEHVDTLYHSQNPITGVPNGYKELDEITAGLQPSDLIIIAGRPAMGKTAFALNIAEYAGIKSEKAVLIFSLEMPTRSLAMRMLSSLGRIDHHHLRTGKLEPHDWPHLTRAASTLSQPKVFIDDTPRLTPTELRAIARRIVKEQKELALIVIDYLQLMTIEGTKENRATEISYISRALKSLARELNVPIIALSQLNRALDQRADKRPLMSDLRESSAIEQDADLIMFIYRDEVYNNDSPDKGMAEIIVAKQRNGETGTVKLTFLGKYTRFENFAEPEDY